jgi:flagellar protein FliO/FliZ
MSTVLMFGRTFLALAIVLGVVWGLSRLMRRAQGGGGRRRRSSGAVGTSVNVLARRSLSRTSAIALVRVGDHNLVVGTTPQNITLICEIPTSELDLDEGPPPPPPETPWTALSGQKPQAWDAVISKLRDMSVRR